ncbi:MAG: small-conductance mechanosensitive channel [Lentimonas sp.]|jgi:small-conductance mechanosensitive channel
MDLENFVSAGLLQSFIRAFAILGIGLPIFYFTSQSVGAYITRRSSEHLGLMTRKIIFFLGCAICLITVLYEFGFKLNALLGAAGVASVAIGFAAQTSLSNIISGIFLYWEKPFAAGDIIRVGETTGSVISIDLMSVKLRTYDNLFVRIPNETMVKAEVTNITKFPIRRMDINIGVAYKEDVDRVIEVLKDVADKNPYCLDEPEPLIIFKNYGESSLDFLLGLWFEKTQYVLLRNSIMRDVKKRFDAEGIEIPFPHRTLYTGSVTEPFPVKILMNDEKA